MQQIMHGLVTLALIGAYVAMTVLNHDGNPLLGVLIGYLGGAGVSQATTSAGKGSSG